MSYIICSKCQKSFSDQDWTDGEVQLHMPQRIWICMHCNCDIIQEWIEKRDRGG